MTKVTVQLPESLQRSIRALAEREGYSIDQFLASAAADGLAAVDLATCIVQSIKPQRLE